MSISESANVVIVKRDLIHLSILLAIALGIGIYLIATTVCIARDSVTYIEYAKELAVNPAQSIRGTFLHPGYSFLIYNTHKLIGQFYEETPLEGWIISAQSVALLCKIIATVVLYFVGRLIVGPQMSFWAVLILTVLPIPADYGSDALTDWPHIMFLATGFFLLLLGAISSKWWLFGCAGIIAGLGYFIRPECCQLVVYGTGWLLFNLIRPQNKMSRARAFGAFILLLASFAAITIPYMSFMGYIFPEHEIGTFPLSVSTSSIISPEIAKGIWKLSSNIFETLMYYFTPALLIGSYYHLRTQAKREKKFFEIAFILLNVIMLLWLYCVYGYISNRHSFPLVAFTIFFVPIGLQILADWLSSRFSRDRPNTNQNLQLWFFVLFAVGVVICLPKLLRPIRPEKEGYRTAAKWLKENTRREDTVAVSDRRITFYAERSRFEYEVEEFATQADYVVRIVEKGKEEPNFNRASQKEYSVWVDKRQRRKKIVIYKML